MPDELIAIIDLAGQLGRRKQTVFKILRRLRIEPQKLRSSNHRGQLLAYITTDESRLVAAELHIEDNTQVNEAAGSLMPALLSDQGVFYLLELESEHDPGRFKVGFATSISERLRTLRCSAPFAKIVKTWPCKLLWEKTAIDCVTQGCEQLHTEVFRAETIDLVIHRCEQFFKMMPSLKNSR